MNINGRYDHIEDVLAFLHSGQWFGWSDINNKVYANLVIHNSDYDKPTEKSLTDALAKQQSDNDAQEYARNRKAEYPSIEDQQDMQFHDAIDGTTTWQDAIQAVKNKYPKSE